MRKWIGVLVGSALIAASTCGEALAQSPDNPLGFYTGVGLGVGMPDNHLYDPAGGRVFRSGDLGWDAFMGIRPDPLLGAELQYMDFGYPHVASNNPFGPGPYDASGHTYALGAFGVVYVPVRWVPPWIDLFGKLGVAQAWTSYRYGGNYPAEVNCGGFGLCSPVGRFGGSVAENQTDLAYGGGAQLHFGAFALRAEYQVVDASFGNPSLFTIGVAWTP